LAKTIQEVWYTFYFLTLAVNSTDLVEIVEVHLFLCRSWRRMWEWRFSSTYWNEGCKFL